MSSSFTPTQCFCSKRSKRTVVTMDASLKCWGAVWDDRIVSCVLKPLWKLIQVHLAVVAIFLSIWGGHILIRTDSSFTVYHINHHCVCELTPGGTEAPVLGLPVFCFSQGNLYSRSSEARKGPPGHYRSHPRRVEAPPRSGSPLSSQALSSATMVVKGTFGQQKVNWDKEKWHWP